VFKDYGPTRASNCRFGTGLNYAEIEDPLNEPTMPPIVLAPGKMQRLPFGALRKSMSKETFDGIRNGSLPMIFTAIAEYDDAFGRHHVTRQEGCYRSVERNFEMTLVTSN